jgi:adenine phosphoribosyltransferase
METHDHDSALLEQRLKSLVRDVRDFPQPGIVFKDITPLLKDPAVCSEIADVFAARMGPLGIDVVTGVESRGFLFGMLLAQRLGVPFVPVRKSGKLPYHKISYVYSLEYGSAVMEMHQDAIAKGQRVLMHDDLLATGGTMVAASEMVKQLGGTIAGYAFLISLDFLEGRKALRPYSDKITSIINY